MKNYLKGREIFKLCSFAVMQFCSFRDDTLGTIR
jgi:hypothetical protein